MAQTKDGAVKTAAKRIGITEEEFRAKRDAGQKHCTKCKEWLPVELFGVDPTRGDGRASSCAPCRRVKTRKSTKGCVSAFKGQVHSEESRAKISAALAGRQSKKKGIPRTAAERANIRAGQLASPTRKTGKDHPNYKHGAAQRAFDDRRLPEYKAWRYAVFARDGFACKRCGDAKGGNLRAHHIMPFATHPELRFAVDNGITLCHPCHELEHFKPESTRNVRKMKRGERLWK